MEDDFDAGRENAIETADEWYERFADSPAFEALTESQQDEAGAIIEFMAGYAYDYREETPEQWGAGTVNEICGEILPRKVTAGPEFFEAVSPVMAAFFTFLQEQSLHPKGKLMAKTVSDLHKKIMSRSQDPSTWGMAKGIMMMARSQGVDLSSQKEVNEFMAKLNASRLPPSLLPSTPHLPPLETKPAPPPFKAPSNPYDPCPCGSGKKFKFCCKAKFG